jgi:phage tail sheath protein FI
MPLDADLLPSAMANVFPEMKAEGGLSASSAFVQLAYPWLRTTRSPIVLEGLEAPDGTLAGLLARNALVRGTFTSATKIPPVDVIDLVPELTTYETQVPASKPTWTGEETARPLVVRVSLFGFTPSGIRLLSDVTTFPGESYRPAPINRLVSVISRAARRFGETHVFEDNGPRLWGALERTIRNLLTKLWSLGALEGATPAEAFNVRCSRDTMTQNDIDSGRIVAVIGFQAAASIELITVTLTVQAGAATDAEIAAQMVGPV